MNREAQTEDRPRPIPFQGVAQLVACRTWNAEVVGSSPTALTTPLQRLHRR